MAELPSPWLVDPCPPEEAARLARELGILRTTAEVLIRRGHTTAEAARAFLDQDGPAHDPMLLGDMAAACERVERAIATGEAICVHGDYDADGICATALAVIVLRGLGAKVASHLPSRFDEGYGLAVDTVERLAGEGVRLLLTVDCGITAVDAVACGRELGVDVIVTDHHRPAEALPACTRVCTRPSEYPFPELCGTGVVFKLAQALHARAGRDPSELENHLDLVALATIADVVPLRDENRGLVRAGLRRLQRTSKPGLRALMAVARVDRAHVSSTDVGFRLAPRINAAGRLCHPDEALELLMTDDERRARALAERLEALNRERQAVEDGILRQAVLQVEEADEEWRARRAYVLYDPDWHEGVIGIVASRLVDRYARPVVLIAGDGDEAKGSGRSVAAYDLHAGLTATAEHLTRFGGHRVAAGLTMRSDRVEAFAAALAGHAAEHLADADLRRRQWIDAVLAPAEASLELADELHRLEPFGLGNPGVTLLAPAAALHGVERIGEGRHLRMAVELGGLRCGAVWFGHGGAAAELRQSGRFDVAYRLSRNDWNGAASAQMLVRAVAPVVEGEPPVPHANGARPAAASGSVADARGGGVQIATVARLVAAGEPVLILVADVVRRAGMLRSVLRSERLGSGWVELAEYGTADADLVVARFHHVVALDPPADAAGGELLAELGSRLHVHLVWGPAEVEFAREVVDLRAPLRDALAVVWRADRDGAAVTLPAETVERCRTVLREVGLAPGAGASAQVDLESSPTYRAAREQVEHSHAYLRGQAGEPAGTPAPLH
jgi:single-stranded-DNA-specific exonuclease